QLAPCQISPRWLYLSHSAKSPSAHPGEYPDSYRDVAYLLFKSPGENRGFFIFRVPGSGCQASPHHDGTTPRRDLRSGGSPPRKGGDHATCPKSCKTLKRITAN